MAAVIPLLGALVAGCVHALEMDHMAAVTAFVSRRPHPLRAFGFGVRWALGHSLAILVAGGLLLALGLRPPAGLIALLEAAVGVMLVALGGWVMVGAARESGRGASARGRSGDGRPHRHEHGTSWVGAAHGLAGTGGFLAIVPASTLASPGVAAAYLAFFGLGTVLAMGLYAAAAGLVLHRAGSGRPRLDRSFRLAAGCASAVVGVVWLLGTL